MHGDISNRTVPKLLLVFEGALGIVPDKYEKQFSAAHKRKKWKKMIDLFEINELLSFQIVRVFMQDRTIEVVTFLGEDFAEMLKVRLQDVEDLPIHDVWASEPRILARKVTLQTDVAAVYDPDPNRQFLYGHKGRVLQNPAQFGG